MKKVLLAIIICCSFFIYLPNANAINYRCGPIIKGFQLGMTYTEMRYNAMNRGLIIDEQHYPYELYNRKGGKCDLVICLTNEIVSHIVIVDWKDFFNYNENNINFNQFKKEFLKHYNIKINQHYGIFEAHSEKNWHISFKDKDNNDDGAVLLVLEINSQLHFD